MIEEIKKNAKSRDVLTKFLTAEEQKQLQKSRPIFSSVGYERHRAYLGREDDIDFQISVLKINYAKKFFSLTHPMILGSMMALGIQRNCIGDILVGEEVYVVCIREMSAYLQENLQKIGQVSVDVEEVDSSVLEELTYNPYVEDTLIVSSMRLDTIVRGITNFSREKAQEYIQLKQIKVNGALSVHSDTVLKEGDLLSIHRFGRTVIKEIVRKTKKDKIVLLIERTN